MDRHNLARIFGPTLVGHGTPNPTPLAIMEDTPRQCLVVSHLLALPLKFWRRFVGEEQENLVPSAQKPNVTYEQGELDGVFWGGRKLRDCIGTATFPPS
uniref:Rho-GAP domain-containing protein n=1 Tax=Varanus komodoensis TaxID=61221 RepID=A0A8D2INZ8_VARKO